MARRSVSLLLAVLGAAPFSAVFARQDAQEKTCEQVYKNITVFKGVPASDLIPAMEFMCASLKWKCTNCHNAQDFSAETRAKQTAREMVLIERDINQKYFNSRTTVTCMTCHRGAENPVNLPTPEGTSVRHQRVTNGPKPEDLFAKHTAAVGAVPAMLVRTGTLTAPDDATGTVATVDLEMDQAAGGRFRIVSKSRTIVSDGSRVTYDGQALDGEPMAIFQRIGRTWMGDTAFAGLDQAFLSGKDKIGDKDVLIVRGTRTGAPATEELYFDAKSGLLVRTVSIRRSSLGSYAMTMDYENYKSVGGAKAPMKVTVSFANGETWVMQFKSGKSAAVDDSLFKTGG